MFRLDSGRMASRRIIKSEAPFYNGVTSEYDAGSYLTFARRGNVFSAYFSPNTTIPLADVTPEVHPECALCDAGLVGLPHLQHDLVSSFAHSDWSESSSEEEYSDSEHEDASFHDDPESEQSDSSFDTRMNELAGGMSRVTLQYRSPSHKSELVKFLFRGIKNYTYASRSELDSHVVQWHEYEDSTELSPVCVSWSGEDLDGSLPCHFLIFVMTEAHSAAVEILANQALVVDVSREDLDHQDVLGCLLYASLITDRLDHLFSDVPTVFVVPSNFVAFRALCPSLSLHEAVHFRHTLWLKQKQARQHFAAENLNAVFSSL